MLAVYHHPCGRRETLDRTAPKPPCSACDRLFDHVETSFSYRDVLARIERKRPDGSPVWPLRDSDLPSSFQPARRHA